MFVTMVIAALIVDGLFSALGLIPTGPRPTRADIFSSIQVDYKLALNLLGVAIFAALFWLTARRGATDPVCGMKVDRDKAVTKEFGGETYYFCSDHCLHAFEADPEQLPARDRTRRARPRRPCPPLSRTRRDPDDRTCRSSSWRNRRRADRRADRPGLDTRRGRAAPAVPRPGEARRRDHRRDRPAHGRQLPADRRLRPDQRPDVSAGRAARRASIASHDSSATSATDPRPRRHDHGADQHDNGYTADNVDLDAVVEQLGAARETLGRIAELTDNQLDAIPPNDSFRFCDGQRTLEQVLASLLKHQGHQVEALKTAVA